MKKLITTIALVSTAFLVNAQVFTKEDSLSAGLVASNNTTVISGYGQAKVNYDLRFGTGQASLTRNVVFLGHKFNDKFGFFSETELEHAKAADGAKGEISLEQLFIKVNLNRDIYLVTGLFIPRIGIINENHLPNTFNGNDRPYVEELIIPSTWREIGVSLYGQTRLIPGLNYSVSLMNGLNAANFKAGSGIREGRQEGSFATASNIAVSGSLLYYYKNFRIQTSGYIGGSSGLSKREADSLQMDYGIFGAPVSLVEANLQYHNKGIQFKALTSLVNISDATKINRAYNNNTPNQMYGYYIEAGYNLMYIFNKKPEQNLTLFGRYEEIDLNSKLAENGVNDDFQKKQFIVAGLTYLPIRGVAFKADYVYSYTGEYNKQLYVTNPYQTVQPFYRDNSFVNVGIAYSF